MIRPFLQIPKAGAAAGAATTRYVERRLKEVLGRLHFTGNVSTTGDAHLHIGGGAGGTAEHAFQLGTTGAGITVAPGNVFFSGSRASVRLNGRDLSPGAGDGNWTPPVLTVGVGVWDICLTIRYRPVFGAQDIYGVPITYLTGGELLGGVVNITAFADQPAEVASQISYPEATATEGRAYVRLGSVRRSAEGSLTVLTQDWKTSIAAGVLGNGLLFLRAA